jgi:CubicO group peptidase (beta-lactamase class C family)
MPIRRTLLLLPVLLHATPAAAQSPAPGPTSAGPVVRGPLGAAVDEYLSRIEAFGFSGAVLVARGDDVVLSKGYGPADSRGTPVTPRTVFYSASIAKQFTAAAILRLAEQGRLSPSDPITRFFPDVPEDKRAITVHQLLTHSSGLTMYFPEDGSRQAERDPWVRALLASRLEFAPGSRAEYSNAGFSLLAAVVERASGQPYERFVREQLFQPAGFVHGGFVSEMERWAPGEAAWGIGGGIKADPGRLGGGWGSRGASEILVSVEDLWRWERALRSGRVLSRASLDALWRGYVPLAPGAPIAYGYGWRVQQSPGPGQVIWASGLDQPFSAMYRRYVDGDLTLIFLGNGAVDALAARDALFPGLREGTLGQIVTGGAYTLPPWFLAEPLVPPAAYAGVYRLPSGATVEVRAEGDRLRLVPRGQEAASLLLPPPADSLSPPYDSLNARVLAAVTAPGADTSTVLGLGPVNDEGLVHPAPAERLGRFQGVEWMITLPVQVSGSVHRATTYALLRFERGTFPMRWRWWNGSPYGRDVGFPIGVLPPFRPQSAHDWVSYHLPMQRAVHIRFREDGGAWSLVIAGATGPVVAERIGEVPAVEGRP